MSAEPGIVRGLELLRSALADILGCYSRTPTAGLVPAIGTAAPGRQPGAPFWWLQSGSLMDQPVSVADRPVSAAGPGAGRNDHGDAALATSSEEDQAVATRLIALVEMARNGDKEAFGQLYDHYQSSVYRFLYYRVNSVPLAEDLASETFFRALRSMNSFRWQGKDFGAWLMTIARNLAADHFKAGRTRMEQTTEDMQTLDATAEGPESEVLASLTSAGLLSALRELPNEQRECLIMRFLQGLSIAETAEILGRSTGAVKQLQLRGVRNLGKLLPAGVRE